MVSGVAGVCGLGSGRVRNKGRNTQMLPKLETTVHKRLKQDKLKQQRLEHRPYTPPQLTQWTVT